MEPSQLDPKSSYLKHDLTTLGVLLAIVAGLLVVLWYSESHGGTFGAWARSVLDGIMH